ncbi:MAG TPA: response regulator transcription factor, partial [Anaerolineales bacterium]|nr:response regulator transcription factor [Anaerolineales bacterium]
MDPIGIIIVDDHPLFREGVRNVLDAEEGMQVLGEGVSGEQAVELIRDLRPTVALVDVNLPVLNGIQVTRQISADRLGTSIVLLTA